MRKITSYILLFMVVLFSCNTAKFTISEKKIIRHKYKNQIMSLMLVSNSSDSVILYRKSKSFDVSKNDWRLKKLVKHMYKTCVDTTNPGVGIAAPQVGINKRIIWVQRFDKIDEPFEVYFNIEIIKYYPSESECVEGCLSIPGYRGFVKRSDSIIIKYDTFKQQNISETIKGFTAVIFQHEIDHLEGILYTDRILDKSKLYTEEEYILNFYNNSEHR